MMALALLACWAAVAPLAPREDNALAAAPCAGPCTLAPALGPGAGAASLRPWSRFGALPRPYRAPLPRRGVPPHLARAAAAADEGAVAARWSTARAALSLARAGLNWAPMRLPS